MGSINTDDIVLGSHSTVNVTYRGKQVAIPSIDAVAEYREMLRQKLVEEARNRRCKILADIHEKKVVLDVAAILSGESFGLAEFMSIDGLFTSADVQEKGVVLSLEASFYDQGRLGIRKDLLSILRTTDHLLVLGEPGTGKTASLKRLEWELCLGPEPLIPVMISLVDYDGMPLANWVWSKLTEGGYLRIESAYAMAAFLEAPPVRCFFLFDGLNEVALPYRDILVNELIRLMAGCPQHTVICACRPKDEIWQHLSNNLRMVVVHPLDDERITSSLAGVVESLFHLATDPDIKIAKSASQVLLQMGDAARNRALQLAQEPTDILHQAGLNYLEQLLGFPVVYVQPGSFEMGSDEAQDPHAIDEEMPKHQITLAGYWIAKTPVTVAQFRAFVEAKKKYEIFEDSLKDEDDHPVRYVTWDEAMAYCRWLTKHTGLMAMLPSEAEWEKAARGTDGRLYPWGNTSPDCDLCTFGHHQDGNFFNLSDYSGLEVAEPETTSVGRYSPQGDSPYGCIDMAGNVWEWTRSLWGKNVDKLDFRYPYNSKDGREDLRSRDFRVLRGGWAGSGKDEVRCAARICADPGICYSDVGFRPVFSPDLTQLPIETIDVAKVIEPAKTTEVDYWYQSYSSITAENIDSSKNVMETKVVGVTYEGRQSIIALLTLGEEVLLVREPNNPYDGNAIRVIRKNGQCFGFINRQLSAMLAPELDEFSNPITATVTLLTGDHDSGLNLGVTIKFKVPDTQIGDDFIF